MCGKCWGPKIEIGGNKIDQMYTDWVSIWQELTEAPTSQTKEAVVRNQRLERIKARLRTKLKTKVN
jgi:hypothetical protein